MLAHVRRKFFDIQQAQQSPIADGAMKRIAELYAIEKEIRGKPPEERVAVRQSRARPLRENMRAWFDRSLTALSRKSDVAAAIRYTLGCWRALTRYADGTPVQMSNLRGGSPLIPIVRS